MRVTAKEAELLHCTDLTFPLLTAYNFCSLLNSGETGLINTEHFESINAAFINHFPSTLGHSQTFSLLKPFTDASETHSA
jgi:hypothetical protein